MVQSAQRGGLELVSLVSGEALYRAANQGGTISVAKQTDCCDWDLELWHRRINAFKAVFRKFLEERGENKHCK